ncbi:MAG TPA: RNA-binding protein [Rhodothermales bacterium]|nr:RNA-binding protein [Rhodothermales bacterium]
MNIYAGNLPHATTEAELRVAFEAYGNVSTAAIIKDKFTGDSRGFGFVEMPDRQEAQAAIGGLNGKDFGDRRLTVNEAKPREERSGGGRRSF